MKKLTNEEINALVIEFSNYEKTLLSMNVTRSTLHYLNDCVITVKTERFEKLGRKNFPRKATETTVEEISLRSYLCYITSVGFFNDRVERGYTLAGYIPTRITCIRPDKEVRIVRSFTLERGEN